MAHIRIAAKDVQGDSSSRCGVCRSISVAPKSTACHASRSLMACCQF